MNELELLYHKSKEVNVGSNMILESNDSSRDPRSIKNPLDVRLKGYERKKNHQKRR